MITTDKLKAGESMLPLKTTITPKLNKQFLGALSCALPMYEKIVHPSILIGMSNITRSPSYCLDNGVAAVHVYDEIEFSDRCLVGDTLFIIWDVTDIFYKRNKNWKDVLHQVVESKIFNGEGCEVAKRRIIDIFVRQ